VVGAQPAVRDGQSQLSPRVHGTFPVRSALAVLLFAGRDRAKKRLCSR
jgi:hypothetical protein